MIIVKLKGGLGNQMFQYAIGRSLSIKHNTDLKLDISFFSNQVDRNVDYREFALNNFRIKGSIATVQDINQLTRRTKFAIVDKLINRIWRRKSSFIYHNSSLYQANLKQLPDNSYLEGYFQSYKYFEEIDEYLKAEFLPRELNFNHIEIDSSKVAVSIHIRRGDYVGSSLHPVCNLDYYRKAITYLIAQIGQNLKFYIFSDDYAWVRSEFIRDVSLKSFIIVEGNKENPVADLYMMSKCKHNIIANSTFSWWAAWLNKTPEKIVIAPKKWFNNETFLSSDLIPPNWIKV